MSLHAAHGTTAADAIPGAAVAPAPTERTDRRRDSADSLESPRIDAAAFAASLEDYRAWEHV